MKKTRSRRAAYPAAKARVKKSHADRAAPDPPVEAQSRAGVASFPIVGIGASAGGLEAFSALLARLPIDTGMGFVLVQHLDPQHESALTQLLSRATTMPVQEVTDGLPVQPNHVYVIPRNTNLGIDAGVLTLGPRPNTRAPHRSIDFFLEALAADQRALAIGVILSGTATDGTLGLEAIKAEGGITFAQDESARYDSMPRSAVAAGCVDAVLSPEQIADEIARIARHPHVVGSAQAEPLTRAEGDRASATAHEDDDTALPSGGRGAPDSGAARARAEASQGRVKQTGNRSEEEGFRKILLLLRNHAGVDFSLYKSNTIRRRITRRLILTKHDTAERYAQFLRGNAHELDALYSDVLISVTSFFRNPDSFEILQRKVLPTLLQQRGDDPLRVWVLGCSTGQEAYSLAMSFVEAAEKAPRMRRLQVFATDLNEALLDKARHGLYAKSVAQDLSPDRLRRFFIEEEGGYRVNKALREMVVFARQNVINDPPFSRLDLISCRNLLIYFEPELQRTLFPAFHHALKPGGFLCLGASESIGSFTALFEPIDKKHKIYARKSGAHVAFQLPLKQAPGDVRARAARAERAARMPAPQKDLVDPARHELTAQREADRVSVNQFAPPAVLINADLQILQFRGPTGAYLEPPTGKATLDVLKMARRGLMLPLRAAITQAKKDNKTIRRDHVRVDHDGTSRTVSLQVIPLKNLRERSFLVVFDAGTPATAGAPATQAAHRRRGGKSIDAKAGRTSRDAQSRRIGELEAELAEMRDYHQGLQEQHEAANEELQASNEEVQSANEELQSINEELETSKEELQSANEELTTVNEEMATRNAELNRLNSDLVNVQTSTQQAIVLLSRNLTIRRFSAQAERQFNLLAADVGRPFGSVRHNLDVPDLDRFITEVIDSVRAGEREVQDRDGRWFSLRVRPYLTLDNKVDGAVLVLVDTTDLKRKELSIAATRDYAQAILRTARDPLLILHADLRVDTANDAFYDTFKVSATDAEGRLVYELGNHQWDIPRLRELLEDILPRNSVFDDFEVTHDFDTIGRRTMLLNARKLSSGPDGPEKILLGIQDATDLLEGQSKLRESEERYRTLFELGPMAVYTCDRAGVIQNFNRRAAELWGREPVPGDTDPRFCGSFKMFRPDGSFMPHEQCPMAEVVAGTLSEVRDGEVIIERPDGSRITVIVNILPLRDGRGEVVGAINCFYDITARKDAEEGRARLSAIVESSDDAIVSKGLDGIITSWNAGAERLFGYSAQEAVGQPVTILIPPDRLDEETFILERVRQAEVVAPFDTVRRRKDGTLFDASITVSPVRDSLGRVVGAAKIARDITERKRTEEALRDADRHKNEFLAMLAHELRNPLAPILVSVEIIRQAQRLDEAERLGDDSPKPDVHGHAPRVDHAVDVLQRQTGQMVRLVEDLLDAGRISSGKIDLRREHVELSSVVHHAVDAARPLTERRDQELTVVLPLTLVYVDADPTRLAQIVGNLLNNASKFTERAGHIWLTVEESMDSIPGDVEGASHHAVPQVVIRVRDNGVGIAPDRLGGIFDMFTQIDRSLERSVAGLGIGLTLVKTLAEMHGGTVEATSPGVGYGSEFVVRLPIIIDAPTLAAPPPLPQPTATPLRILVVDDNRDSADMLAILLKFSGHETHTAHDGMAAVEEADRLDPDVIVLDIGLPVLNGYEAARRIRERKGDNGRPLLVALTGWGQDEDRDRSKEAGFDAHLVKPVDEAALRRLLAGRVPGNQNVKP